MASIRLFGRGKSAAAAGADGAGLGAAQIAEVLEGLTAASMSTTWRCRHGAGVSIGEGAVDFATRRSRATVIRGKYAFEYVREGASVLRTPVTDTDDPATPAAAAVVVPSASADGVEEPDEEDEGLDEETDSDLESESDEEFEDSDADGDELDEENEDEDVDADVDSDSEEESEAESETEPEVGETSSGGAGVGAGGTVAWERFSDHDACGVHAYAEPSVLAAGVLAAGVVQPREAQEFDGVLLAAYAVTVKPKPGDPNKVLARLARQLRDHGANVLVVTAFVDESGEGDAADEDEAGPRIVRVRVELPHWTPADDPTADHTVSVDLFEFDEPVSIEVPDGAGAARRASRSCADLALF